MAILSTVCVRINIIPPKYRYRNWASRIVNVFLLTYSRGCTRSDDANESYKRTVRSEGAKLDDLID